MEIPSEIMIEGVALAVGRFLSNTTTQERLLLKIAELQTELLTPFDAAKMLGVTPKTLRDRATDWGLDRSILMGPTEPRFYRSQIVKLADERRVKGRRRSENLEVRSEKGVQI